MRGEAGVIWTGTLCVLNKCIKLYKCGGSLYKHAVAEMWMNAKRISERERERERGCAADKESACLGTLSFIEAFEQHM